MVDTTQTQNMLAIAAADHQIGMDQSNNTADKWMSNIKALIKLRQRGATKVSELPSGVFRCILEYNFPNELLWRYSGAYLPYVGQQDRHFPAIEKLDFYNYLVAIDEIPNDWQFQFTLRDGAICSTKGELDNWTRTQVHKPEVQVRKIELGYYPGDQGLKGLKFYDKDGAVILQTGWNWVANQYCRAHTVHLKDGERVIGYKSKRPNLIKPHSAIHRDFQFIIGRLD